MKEDDRIEAEYDLKKDAIKKYANEKFKGNKSGYRDFKKVEDLIIQNIDDFVNIVDFLVDDNDKKNKTLIQIEEIFKKFDFILLPSSQVFPFNKNIQYPKKINEQELDTYHRWLEVFIISSLFDLPTLTVPIGFNDTGSPMGLQIIAKKGDDIKLLSFAKTYEKIYKYSNIKAKFKL